MENPSTQAAVKLDVFKECCLVINFLSSVSRPRLPLAHAGGGWRREPWGCNTVTLCQTSGVQAEADRSTSPQQGRGVGAGAGAGAQPGL